ncbi:dihydroneopterin aldolase [Aliiroseovarius sp. S1339]|uniref:dihydroneopterin aldolase n=1 Tax=Aliiroseovarius sp. S1339 TaxID=2936990 RepID=UPI0020BDA82D|nr:dihydroneopterin aldolase [Aliiroseovarius sp. S1339]MCK8465301.1 dihydroneopterin aldolase [Aliiroseovarius sp. S1339]
MTDDASIAFGTLEQRAGIEPDAENRPDRISVRDHVVDVEIGAFQSERGTTQRLSFSVVAEVAPNDGAQTDDVDDILSYDKITEAIGAELAAERLNLLETLAERIADRILTVPQPLRVFVRIEKLDRGPGKLGVEIVRTRVSAQAREGATKISNPRVIYLESAAFTDPDLRSFLDRLAADPRAFVLCVGMGDSPGPQVDDATAQRHIDLLAIEQNAWRLSATDARCVVVGTRTELDWGMKNNQISVWAPSKLVLDAVDGPTGADPRDLAAWLADALSAKALVVVGEDGSSLQVLP